MYSISILTSLLNSLKRLNGEFHTAAANEYCIIMWVAVNWSTEACICWLN